MSVVPVRLACMGKITGKIDTQDALVKQVRAGAHIKYLHFWGHRPRADGRVGASCLSQWWPSPFVVDGVTYATAEHWMMAGKARLFEDREAETRVLNAGHPSEAKKAGRLVRGFDEQVWQRERFAIVFGIKGRKRAERGEATNRGQAQAGFITGIIGTILGLIMLVFMAFVIVAAVNSDDEPDYYDGSLPAVAAAQQY